MDFELSDDQVALQDAAKELLDGYASPGQVRRIVDGGGGLDASLWAAMVGQGWLGVAVPESLGGLGMGWVELAVLLEQTGAHMAPAPFAQQVVAIDALARLGVVTADGAPLAGLLDGSSIATVAFRPVSATPSAGHWTLSGSTEPAVFAPRARYAFVRAGSAALGSGSAGDESLFFVDLEVAGISTTREPAMDLTRELGWLHFDDTHATRLGGADAVAAFLDAGAVAHSCEMLGSASSAMALAVDYAKERKQFGQPIGSFQAVKHRCADMLVDVEGMRSAALYAAWCMAADDPDRSVAASTAKTWCSDAGMRVAKSALQVHGGIGFTWECDVHFYLKRSQLDAISFGDAAFHRARLADLLRARLTAGHSVI